jgi:hypothetical protein
MRGGDVDSETRKTFLGPMNSYDIVLQTLINRLHANGVLSRPEFCDELKTLSNKLEHDWRDEPGVFDVGLIRSFESSLRVRDPYPIPTTDVVPANLHSANDDAPESK